MQLHLLGYSEATIAGILEVLQRNGYNKEVTIVQNMELPESIPYGVKNISCKKIFADQWTFDPLQHHCMIAVTSPAAKKKVFDFFSEKKQVAQEHYTSIIDPSANIASTVIAGNGCFAEAGSIMAAYAKVGFSVHLNRAVSVGHHAIIGDYVNIGPAAHIAGHCRIGNAVQVGMGAIIFDHVTVGENSIIGGGSVVTKDIPANVVAWGNPCKVIKQIEDN